MRRLICGLLLTLGVLGAAPANATIRESLAALTLSAAAESADHIAVTVTGAASTTYVASLYAITGIESVAAAHTLAESGAGSEISTTANSRLIFSTSAGGAATLDAHDVEGGTNTTTYLVVCPLGVIGECEYLAVVWDVTDSTP